MKSTLIIFALPFIAGAIALTYINYAINQQVSAIVVTAVVGERVTPPTLTVTQCPPYNYCSEYFTGLQPAVSPMLTL